MTGPLAETNTAVKGIPSQTTGQAGAARTCHRPLGDDESNGEGAGVRRQHRLQGTNSAAAGEGPAHPAIDEAIREQFAAQDAGRFPLVTRFAAEMTAGDGDDRFEFGLDVLVAGLAAVSERYR